MDTKCTPTECKALADHVPECWARGAADDGGPAYPATSEVYGKAGDTRWARGMSFRDRAAMEFYAVFLGDDEYHAPIGVADVEPDPEGGYIVVERKDGNPYVARIPRDSMGRVLPQHENDAKFRCVLRSGLRTARDAYAHADNLIAARKMAAHAPADE